MSIHKYLVIPRYYFLIVTLSFVPTLSQAAELRECEQAKLRQLNLEQAARGNTGRSHSKKHSRSNSGKAHQNAEQLDEWLWKNCRNYANELRTLEQQRM